MSNLTISAYLVARRKQDGTVQDNKRRRKLSGKAAKAQALRDARTARYKERLAHAH